MKCFRLYADGRGRAGIAEYWSFLSFNFVVVAILFALVFVGAEMEGGDDAGPVGVAALVGMLAALLLFFLPSVTVSVRRLHDLGVSGWFVLLGLILGSLFTIVIGMIPSSASPNSHGPSPKARVEDAFA